MTFMAQITIRFGDGLKRLVANSDVSRKLTNTIDPNLHGIQTTPLDPRVLTSHNHDMIDLQMSETDGLR